MDCVVVASVITNAMVEASESGLKVRRLKLRIYGRPYVYRPLVSFPPSQLAARNDGICSRTHLPAMRAATSSQIRAETMEITMSEDCHYSPLCRISHRPFLLHDIVSAYATAAELAVTAELGLDRDETKRKQMQIDKALLLGTKWGRKEATSVTARM